MLRRWGGSRERVKTSSATVDVRWEREGCAEEGRRVMGVRGWGERAERTHVDIERGEDAFSRLCDNSDWGADVAIQAEEDTIDHGRRKEVWIDSLA